MMTETIQQTSTEAAERERADTAASAIKAIMAIADVIKDVGQMPSGILYDALASRGCNIGQFEHIITLLTGPTPETALIRQEGCMLIWNQ